MTKKEMLSIFHRSIVNDLQVAYALKILLESIRNTCIKMDGEELNSTNEKIIASVDSLRKNHLMRLKIVNAFGFVSNIEKFIASLPPKIKTQLSDELNKLIQALKKCEEKNVDNGRLFAGQYELITKLAKESLHIKV